MAFSQTAKYVRWLAAATPPFMTEAPGQGQRTLAVTAPVAVARTTVTTGSALVIPCST